jgi:phage terminase large subunit
MLTFVRSESYRPEAQEGAHDDCIMALAIAHHIRPQQEYNDGEDAVMSRWTADMWEDYYNASPEIREVLLRKYGEPEEG